MPHSLTVICKISYQLHWPKFTFLQFLSKLPSPQIKKGLSSHLWCGVYRTHHQYVAVCYNKKKKVLLGLHTFTNVFISSSLFSMLVYNYNIYFIYHAFNTNLKIWNSINYTDFLFLFFKYVHISTHTNVPFQNVALRSEYKMLSCIHSSFIKENKLGTSSPNLLLRGPSTHPHLRGSLMPAVTGQSLSLQSKSPLWKSQWALDSGKRLGKGREMLYSHFGLSCSIPSSLAYSLWHIIPECGLSNTNCSADITVLM